MITSKNILLNLVFAALLTTFVSCSSEDEGADTGEVANNALHLKFKTPDWERTINCDHLDLDPIAVADGVFAVSATSASTNETFYFSYPKDSSAMNTTSNYKKYGIVEYGANDAVFQFSQKLPENQGSSEKLISKTGMSDVYYNEVQTIEYVGHEANFSIFKVKCKYNMQTYLLSNNALIKDVSGTFHFKIRTTRN